MNDTKLIAYRFWSRICEQSPNLGRLISPTEGDLAILPKSRNFDPAKKTETYGEIHRIERRTSEQPQKHQR